jgi:hypothetical protein
MEVIMQQPPWQPNQPPPYQQQPMYYPPPQQPYFQPPPMMMVQPPPKRRLHGCLIAAVVFIALGICGMIMNMFSGSQSSSTSTTPTAQVTDTGEVLQDELTSDVTWVFDEMPNSYAPENNVISICEDHFTKLEQIVNECETKFV